MAERILIVEDDQSWLDIFSEIVSDCGFKPVPVSTFRDALAALARQTFAFAIVDISLVAHDHGDQSGVRVLRKISKLPWTLPAIVVTGYATVDLAVEALVDLNAVHFIRKEKFDRRKFARIIQDATAKPEEPPAIDVLSDDQPAILRALSGREREVLALLIQGQTNKQIAEELAITVNTVKKHVQSIFTKFNVDSRAAAVAKALTRT